MVAHRSTHRLWDRKRDKASLDMVLFFRPSNIPLEPGEDCGGGVPVALRAVIPTTTTTTQGRAATCHASHVTGGAHASARGAVTSQRASRRGVTARRHGARGSGGRTTAPLRCCAFQRRPDTDSGKGRDGAARRPQPRLASLGWRMASPALRSARVSLLRVSWRGVAGRGVAWLALGQVPAQSGWDGWWAAAYTVTCRAEPPSKRQQALR